MKKPDLTKVPRGCLGLAIGSFAAVYAAGSVNGFAAMPPDKAGELKWNLFYGVAWGVLGFISEAIRHANSSMSKNAEDNKERKQFSGIANVLAIMVMVTTLFEAGVACDVLDKVHPFLDPPKTAPKSLPSPVKPVRVSNPGANGYTL